MKELEEIKARAETNSILGKTASQDEAKDTLKLVAALEAVEAIAKHVSQQAVDIYSNAKGMEFDQRIAAASYAVEFEVIAADLQSAITEALA